MLEEWKGIEARSRRGLQGGWWDNVAFMCGNARCRARMARPARAESQISQYKRRRGEDRGKGCQGILASLAMKAGLSVNRPASAFAARAPAQWGPPGGESSSCCPNSCLFEHGCSSTALRAKLDGPAGRAGYRSGPGGGPPAVAGFCPGCRRAAESSAGLRMTYSCKFWESSKGSRDVRW